MQSATQLGYQMFQAAHQAVLDALAQTAPPEVPARGEEVDQGLHNALVEATGNALLQQAHAINTTRIRLIRRDRIRLTRATLPEAFSDHMAIIDAILLRDAQGAIEAMDQHIINARNRAMEF